MNIIHSKHDINQKTTKEKTIVPNFIEVATQAPEIKNAVENAIAKNADAVENAIEEFREGDLYDVTLPSKYQKILKKNLQELGFGVVTCCFFKPDKSTVEKKGYSYTLVTNGSVHRFLLKISDLILQNPEKYKTYVSTLGQVFKYNLQKEEEIILYLFHENNNPPKLTYVKMFDQWWPQKLQITVRRYSTSYIDDLKKSSPDENVISLLDLDAELEVTSVKYKSYIENPEKLKNLLHERLNSTDLRKISDCVNINYEDISGSNISDQLSYFINMVANRQKIQDLIKCVQSQRPDINFNN